MPLLFSLANMQHLKPFQSVSYGVKPGFRSTQGRFTFGTVQAQNLQRVTPCDGERWSTILTHVCGWVQRFHHVSRASKCLVVLLATTISSPESCRPWVRNTRSCCRRSRQCRNLQSGWLLLLHCAAARANYFVRVLRPDVVQPFAVSHDTNVWQCLCNILGIPEDGCSDVARISATFPLALGGLGLRSAQRTCVAAHWASWADTLPMVAARHPTVADIIRRSFESDPQSPSLAAAKPAADELDGISGFEVPRWAVLQEGLRPPPREPEHHEPGGTRAGWQHEAASRVERQFRTKVLLPHMSAQQRAMLRSQSIPVAGVPFSTAPSSPLTRIEPALFRVFLQRRLSLSQLSVWPSSHQRTASSRSGGVGPERVCS